MKEPQKSLEFAKEIRKESLRMVASANASHIGGALSMADLLAVLYAEILRVNPEHPNWPERDRFILSKGHSCVAVYAALSLRGFFPISQLATYGLDGSLLMSHISHKVPGVEFSTGSLGHGLPFACGKSLAAKRQGRQWKTYVIVSDGELNEGSNWEAILFAPHHHLDQLTLLVDYNKIQSMGTVAEVLDLSSLADKFNAFGWNVIEIDGHNHYEIKSALSEQSTIPGKPKCIIANTVKGKGVDYMENTLKWHYSSPNEKELEIALNQL